ncbi:MAG: arginine repressor [Gemmatimonadales bacterium]|jgi:transcriptional regulator of arginine metabolism|nr:arginine repressor [Gemmatimonadales bacterium]MDG2240371.1 arginine repressor [Longimicrobiales bacterium]MBT3499812.1 arginine repressor [Gemmatimonadales bacterium]MBT3774939.1 arginine repressor [Gemmatimonadales bacterium]MBT3958056.1 arginine repressor [Gemmatimonadales bacterium]
MNKKIRHDQILDAIKQHRVTSQEALCEILHAEGTDVTQATVSRDIRELRLVKVPGADGTSHYSMPDEWESTPSLRSLLPTLFQSADGVDHLLVIRTMKGAAQTVAAGIDWEEWPEVLGTLAGDDTVLIILRSHKSLESTKARIEKMASRSG